MWNSTLWPELTEEKVSTKESRRDEFHRYLNDSGAFNAVVNAFGSLYSESTRPQNSIHYLITKLIEQNPRAVEETSLVVKDEAKVPFRKVIKLKENSVIGVVSELSVIATDESNQQPREEVPRNTTQGDTAEGS